MNSTQQIIRRATSTLLALSLGIGANAQSYVNFEGKQTNPIRLSADGTRLFAVNTPDARVSVFDLTDPATPRLIAEIPVGIEPVSVHPRSNDEVWVVNEVSDSVSVVSVSRGIVIKTLRVKDEPMDVVFAGNRAFVSVGRSNELAVFDIHTHEELARIPLRGLNPRALALSPDGDKVYVAFALSGNRTTIIPKEKAPDPPSPANIPDPPPKVALIVDVEDPDWAHEIQYTMPDHDVAEIDVESLAVTRYFSRLGTVNLGLGVNPQTGDLWVANMEARNRVFYEPALRGHTHFNRVTRIDITTGEGTPFDLNPGVDYSVLPNPAARAQALAQPTSIVFDPSGDHFYVAAFGADRVAILDNGGSVLDRIEIGDVTDAAADPSNMRGPRGLALHPDGRHLYVMNRVANSITVIDTTTRAVITEFPSGSHDPTPDVIRRGRGFLYDARLSGNGMVSCASCHVDAEMDHLAWNLGDPGGVMQPLLVTQNGSTTTSFPAHPMKGPMTTQTLRGLEGMEPLHWRGDRASFLSFNPAFSSLMGGEPLSEADMQAFKDFIETIVFAPNPNRNLDHSLPETLAGGDPHEGENFFRNTPFFIPAVGQNITCVACHSHPTGMESRSNFRIVQAAPIDIDQPIKIPHLRNVYKKLHFDNTPGAESLAGFGLEHEGARADIPQALSGPRFESIQNNTTILNNLKAFLLAFNTGMPSAVGHDLTITRENLTLPAVMTQWDTLEQQARLRRIELIAKAGFGGLLYASNGEYRSDVHADVIRSRAWIEDQIGEGATLTLLGVPRGSGVRMGIDRNLDGVLDGEQPPMILSIRHLNGGEEIELSWLLEAHRPYTVEYSETLAPGNWIPMTGDIVGQDGVATFSDSPAAAGPARFYRIRRE